MLLNPTRFSLYLFALTVFGFSHSADAFEGYLTRDGKPVFPVGSYLLPEDDAQLQRMVDSGFNLFRCKGKEDLDRLQKAGALGVLSLGLDGGPTDALKAQANAVKDHPALAVWEGPDEIVWTFTAYSALSKTLGIHKTRDAWKNQSPEAVAYAREKAATIMPNIRASIDWIREADPAHRPVWINEAADSDVGYVREYLPSIDITGCDLYPVKKADRRLYRMGDTVDRWKAVGLGKPVWMVHQGFSWHQLGDYYGHTESAHPSFAESRYMAYDVLAHGARGILFWGMEFTENQPFKDSILALAQELTAVQPFLVAPEMDGVSGKLIDYIDPGETNRGVAVLARKVSDDLLLALVNEDDYPHLGVEITGLPEWEGKTLHALDGAYSQTVKEGGFIDRLPPLGLKVYCTNPEIRPPDSPGREYASD